MRRSLQLALAVVISAETLTFGQEPSAKQVAQERAQAELDAPKLSTMLELEPGMTVADVGAGGGAMTVVLGEWIGEGHVFATDIAARALATIRAYVKSEGLNNVTVIEGAAADTNLPTACCEAIFLRHVYHHITDYAAFNRSLHTALKPGGRLAIIDFVPRKGSEIPAGVPANRGGHGVPPAVVISEVSAAGLAHVKTLDQWPPDDQHPDYFLVLFRK